MQARERRLRLLLGVLLAVGLVLRLRLIGEQNGDLLFEHPVLDEQRYVDTARAMAAGGVGEDRPYWQPPGILYALALILRVAGPGLTAPRVIQALLSTAACLLLFFIGRRLFGAGVGLAAAAILALHGMVVFESYELLPATWMLFFDLVALWALLVAVERRDAPWSFAAGLALGVSALFGPTVLPFVAVAAACLRRGVAVAALVAGVALPIAPVTWHNWTHGHELVLVSTNGGLNFYLGNNRDYAETFALRPGRRWEELATEPARHGIPSAAGASAYFFRRGLAFFRDEPLHALALDAHKARLFVGGAEVPRDTDVYEARRRSGVLALLVWPRWFPDGVLIPLALVGAALAWRERRRLVLVYGLLATGALAAIAFFVSARHRVPSLPLFALFAAAGVAEAARRWRNPRAWVRVGPLAVAAALAVVVNLPTREGSMSFPGELDFYRGLAALRELHRPELAVGYFRSAAAVSDDARIWLELGNALDAAGRTDEAIAAWRRAGARDPWDSRARRRAAVALAGRGDLAGAIAEIQASIDARAREPAHYAPDHLNLAFLRARAGETDAAIAEARAALAADRGYCIAELPRLTEAALAAGDLRDPRFWLALADLDREVGAVAVADRASARAANLQ